MSDIDTFEQQRRFISTYWYDWYPRWAVNTTSVTSDHGRARALRTLTRHRGPAILHGAVAFRQGYVDLLAAGVFARRGQLTILADATWQPGSRALDRLAGAHRPSDVDAAGRRGHALSKAIIRAIDGPTVHYTVLSTDELETFPKIWGVPPSRVHFTPFFASLDDYEPARHGSGVFAGGNSMRDYRALLRAAADIDAPVTIATALPTGGSTHASIGPLAPDVYHRRADEAAVVVVPLVADSLRSGGQQTYLNAMVRGKPVVVTQAPGVRDYIEDGVTGLIVPNEPAALSSAVNRLLRDRALAERIGQAARQTVLDRFKQTDWLDRLLELAERLRADSSRSARPG